MNNILIIDDSPEDREQFEFLLGEAEPGVKAVLCHGGQDGLAAASKQLFDCVLLDLFLDGESGLDVLVKLQTIQPNLPIIVFTGQGSEQAATDAFVAGAAYYLPKHDLTAKTLWTAVARVVKQATTELELKSKQNAMERSNRLDAIGQLAAGIAHDFNNQLAALQYCVELMKSTAVGEKSREQAHTALKIIDASASLASRLLSLSRQGDLMAKSVALIDTFTDLKALATASISDQVMLEVMTPETNLTAFCDSGQLLNVLLNLVLNANDAIIENDESGTITVDVRRDADQVWIVVKDNGAGMSKDLQNQCSDPFFTTKKNTNGTGLGLAIAQGFANENKGELLINSVEGKGTEMTLVLPIGKETDVTRTIDVAAPASVRDMANILIVEDQFLLAAMTKEILEDAGFATEIARDGKRALELLASGFQPDVILTDIKMPGMNGFEFANEVRQKNTKTGIIYLTGYADNPEHEKQVLHGPILQKPVAPSELTATIKKVLNSQ